MEEGVRIKLVKKNEYSFIVYLNDKLITPSNKQRARGGRLAKIILNNFRNRFNEGTVFRVKPKDEIVYYILYLIMKYRGQHKVKEADAMLELLERIPNPFIFEKIGD